MGSSFDYDNMVMEATRLSDLIEERGQRLIYIFDPMYERYFFGNVAEILPGYCDGVTCTESKGAATKQLQTEDLPRLHATRMLPTIGAWMMTSLAIASLIWTNWMPTASKT